MQLVSEHDILLTQYSVELLLGTPNANSMLLAGFSCYILHIYFVYEEKAKGRKEKVGEIEAITCQELVFKLASQIGQRLFLLVG